MRAVPSIEDYAFVSDCQAPALLARDGSVDWWCPPRADAPAVFGRLLGEGAGHWALGAAATASVQRRCVGHSLVVESRLTTPTGEAVVVDALAMEPGARGHDLGMRSPHVLLRSVRGATGYVDMHCEFAPRFEFGLTHPHLWRDADGGLVAEAGPVGLRLTSSVPLELDGATARAAFRVEAGVRLAFSLAHAAMRDGTRFAKLDVDSAIADTIEAWESWADVHPGYEGLHAEVARRSALVLQGLTYQPTGAVLAAATTSLPAAIGGDANWDYRYAWLRDLSLTSQAQWIAACPDEAVRYLEFLADAAGAPGEGARVQIMYAVDGRRLLAEHELAHLSGYRESRPVRVGNAAWDQAQLDVTGEVLDMAHRFADQLEPLDDRVRDMLVWLADEAADTWEQPDAGMWEARDRQRHYLTSKVMCWVALDRAVRLAALLGDAANAERWAAVRDEIHEAVLQRGWQPEVGAFTGAFGSDHLDASVLIMPLVGFLPADDARMRATIDVIERKLARRGLVYRWEGDTNGFVMCSYWLVECLALAGEVDRALALFDEISAYANDLGLLAEQVDPDAGEQTGNFPQAFSHVGLINAAWRLATITGRIASERSQDDGELEEGRTT